MMRTLIRYGALVGVVGLGACDLAVRNPNAPETERVLATPKDLETLLGNYYRRWHDGLYRTLGSVWGIANVQSFENYSSLANNAQNARVGIPRPANDNSIGNVANGEQQRVYFVHGEVLRVATNVMNQLNETGFTLGTPAQDFRAKAFAEFLRGASLGYLALFYDSTAVIAEGMAGDDPGTLVGYREAHDSALAALQRSLDHIASSTAQTNQAGGFPLPAEWIPSSTSFTAAEFTRLVRSYRARFRAGIARTPAERADVSAGGLVDWNAVIQDSQNGITADHNNITNTTTGPFKTWVAQYMSNLPTGGLWHQMTPFVIGMADNSGSYATWTAQPLGSRGASASFFMTTPDLRFPQGADRGAQFADFQITSCAAASSTCKRYFRSRPPGNDQTAGDAWGFSNYDHVRYYPWWQSGDGTGQNGRIVFFTKVELDMLEAEGHIRVGGAAGLASAATLINRSRTRGMVGGVATGGGLPPVLGVAGGGLAGPDCVPKMPVNAGTGGGGTVTCGDLFEAMKWEKRIETAFTHFAGWFLDHRAWGDLPEGTPLQWAPPYQDLQSRGLPLYSIGLGTTGGFAATKGTYGW